MTSCWRQRNDHACTGLKDNVQLDKHALAPCSAAVVGRCVSSCEPYQRPVADAATARQLPGL
ncbi:3-keto-5-aminohexanoate cleavage protein [Sulfitobacter sp. HNIBRBA3233]|uniref:3-keto-5-aminohexanoate cleavage protein n=1 Tax=Sulfitobacter marinivivus TaxID=3158558 RepID=UPI0032DF8C38